MKFILVALLVLPNLYLGLTELPHPKCCDGDSALRRNSSVYECVRTAALKFQIVTNDTDFMAKTNESGKCVDVDDDVAVFRRENGQLVKDNVLRTTDLMPKCCPRDYYYNTKTHSCAESNYPLNNCFSNKVIKIGLSSCKIIADFRLNVVTDLEDCSLHKLNEKYNKDYYCIDRDEKNFLSVLRVCQDDYDVCDSIKCVHKCCFDGQSFVNGSNCRTTYVHGMDLEFSQNIEAPDAPFAIIHGYSPPVYMLKAGYFKLDERGVFSHYENLSSTTFTYDVDEFEYCIEFFEKNNASGYSFFRPFPANPIHTKFIFTRYAMAVSCVFLFLTIVYYCTSKEKRTVFGKTLISYCTASLFLFVLLSYFSFDIRGSEIVCRICVWLILYGTMATFAWMNVMCIDIYWTFGSSKSFSSLQQKSKELKRFMLYSLYGWGFPVVLTAIPLIFYQVDVLPNAVKPLIDGHKCYIQRGEDNYAYILFSLAPIALGEICNSVLFIRTITYCLKVKAEISRMNDTHTLKGEKMHKFNKYKDRLGLLIKLFLIMGVSFLFEVVSSFFNFKKSETTTQIEIAWDTFNSLQGLFIFVIFIFKKRIFKRCQKKVGLPENLRKFSLISSATTQTTSVAHNARKKY